MNIKINKANLILNIAICLILILSTIGGYLMDYKGYFDAVDGSPSYDAAETAVVNNSIIDGIVPGIEDEFSVEVGTGLQVVLNGGIMWSKGRYYFNNDANQTLSIDPAATGYARIDRVVVEYDIDNKTTTRKISKGIEVASNPAANALVTGDAKWEEHLAYVYVDGNTITSVDDTDRVIQGARVKEGYLLKLKRGTNDQESGTDVEFEAVILDPKSIWDISHPERIPAIEDGQYLINYRIYFASTIYNTYALSNAYIKVNGLVEENSKIFWLNGVGMWQGSIILDLTKDEYVSFQPGFSMSSDNKVIFSLCHVDMKKLQ